MHKMSIFHVLYKNYEKAEENGLVDNLELDATGRNIVILPLYHMNEQSHGYDVIQIILDEEGNPVRINFIENGIYTIYPITIASLNRTRNVFAHPLCDNMQYLSKSLNEAKHMHYCEQNEEWLNGIILELENYNSEEAVDVAIFLKQIRELILNEDVLTVLKKLVKDQYRVLFPNETTVEIELQPKTENTRVRKKKINLSDIFITFGKQFSDAKKRDIDITTNKILHQAHTCYIQKTQEKQKDMFDICDVSGKKMYCENLYRGLFGRKKIVSESYPETHIGRFYDSSEVVHLGATTSEKIHLIIKFFLENQDNREYLNNNDKKDNTIAIMWFAEDLLNKRNFTLSDPTMEEPKPWDIPSDDSEENQLTSLADERARDWKKILRGEKSLSDSDKEDFFYLMMINNFSKGRIAIQSTRTIPIMIFLKNLQHWQKTCSWEIRDSRTKEYVERTPRPWDIIRFVYGIEKDDGRVDCLKDELKSSAFKRLLPSVIDGANLPKDMARQIFSNYKNRIGFRKNWIYLQYMSCALLNKVRQDQGKEKRLTMLGKDKQTRDYLYGRLLAIYEKIEMDAMRSKDEKGEDKSNSLRITNVEKVWSAFFQTPERMLETLHMKIRPYLDKLKSNQAGLYSYYNRLIGEIQTEIRDAETYLANKNKALNEDAVFGYYAQNRDLYTSAAEKKENENA
ncbi:MAG TPA: hypothetical protein GXZ43_07010 [Clostridiaceae bacterium]|nr:hypothetical protein [Clostridiaceae bacterium]